MRSGSGESTRPAVADFWDRLNKTEACWLWTGAAGPDGYGTIRLHGKWWRSNRLAWTLAYGEIPPGQWVLHRCDNPRCCRPDHLFLGTAADNSIDMIRKSRGGWQRRPHRPGAKLTEVQVAEIRALRETGESQTAIARKYGMDPSSVSRICTGEYWGSRHKRRKHPFEHKGDT